MATHIADTLNFIDMAVADYAETVFESFGGPVTDVLQAGGVVAIALLAANQIMQFTTLRMGEFLSWAARYVVVLLVATSWNNFLPIYNIITQVPGNIGAELINAQGATDLNTALDNMVTNVFNFSDRANENAGFFGVSLLAIVLVILGALLACVAILVSALAKVGLAMAVSFAPVMIALALFGPTRNIFESWVRFTLGFALIPLVLAGVMAALITVGNNLAGGAGTATTIQEGAAFIIVCFAGIFMMYNIPSLVTGLAGTIVTAGTGIATARAAANTAGAVASAPMRAGVGAVLRHEAGGSAASAVRDNGGGRFAQGAAYLTQASRMSAVRQQFTDPKAFQNGGAGNRASQAEAAKNPNATAAKVEAMKAQSQQRAETQTTINNANPSARRA